MISFPTGFLSWVGFVLRVIYGTAVCEKRTTDYPKQHVLWRKHEVFEVVRERDSRGQVIDEKLVPRRVSHRRCRDKKVLAQYGDSPLTS